MKKKKTKKEARKAARRAQPGRFVKVWWEDASPEVGMVTRKGTMKGTVHVLFDRTPFEEEEVNRSQLFALGPMVEWASGPWV